MVFVPTILHIWLYLTVNDASKAIDDGMNTVRIFVHLSKAFDTNDHGILSEKNIITVIGVSHDWFQKLSHK